MNHRAVLERVMTWARLDSRIRALVLTGSLARDLGNADEEADLDVELYATDPSTLLQEDAWYGQFGEVLVVEALENPGWHPTRLIYYADGKIDFMIAPVAVLAEGVEYDRPFSVLIDKDAARDAFRRSKSELAGPPTATEFFQCIHWFYAAAIMWAKYLARDDPWAAKVRDWDSKTLLLQMLEWDQKARKGWDHDTWYLGTHLREWVDPDLLSSVAACWSGFAREDSIRALWASLSLFETIRTRTAIALGMPLFDGTRIHRRIGRMLRNIT